MSWNDEELDRAGEQLQQSLDTLLDNLAAPTEIFEHFQGEAITKAAQLMTALVSAAERDISGSSELYLEASEELRPQTVFFIATLEQYRKGRGIS